MAPEQIVVHSVDVGPNTTLVHIALLSEEDAAEAAAGEALAGAPPAELVGRLASLLADQSSTLYDGPVTKRLVSGGLRLVTLDLTPRAPPPPVPGAPTLDAGALDGTANELVANYPGGLGAFIGTVVGGAVVLLCCIGLIVALVCCRKRRAEKRMLESSSKVDLGVVGDENDPSSWRPIGDYGSGRIGVGNRPPPPPTIPGRFRLQNKRDELWKTVTTEEGDPYYFNETTGEVAGRSRGREAPEPEPYEPASPYGALPMPPPAPPVPGALPMPPPAPPVPEPPSPYGSAAAPLLDGGAAGAAGARRPLRRVRARARAESALNSRDAPAWGGAAAPPPAPPVPDAGGFTALDLPPPPPPPPGY